MEKVQKELHELFAKYVDFDFICYYHEIAKNNTNNKYSKGSGFHAGLYELSYVEEMITTNSTIGKEIRKIDSGYDYKYYFDENDRIILSEKYVNQRLEYLNFYFYCGNECVLISYFLGKLAGFRKHPLFFICKSEYDKSNRIIRCVESNLWGADVYEATSYEEHLFRYDDETTYVTRKKYHNTGDWAEREYFLNKFYRKGDVEITEMMIKESVMYILNDEGEIKRFYPIRFKLVNGKKVNVPLPKKVHIFKIIKENMINILSKWKYIDKSVIWILCESTDLVMQYTTLKTDCEEKWNIAFYDADEEKVITDNNHIQVLEDLLFNNDCDINDLLCEGVYFVERMTKIIKELRKEGYISDDTAVILSDLEISEKTFEIAKKINKKEAIKNMASALGHF